MVHMYCWLVSLDAGANVEEALDTGGYVLVFVLAMVPGIEPFLVIPIAIGLGFDPVLTGFAAFAGSVTVAPGETVGLVGPTGAGKTTLTKLLMRLYDTDEGTVRLDGHDIQDITVRSLRDHLGYVSQEPFLFGGTIRENVSYGVSEASGEAIITALEQAGAREFVGALEDRLDTVIRERGVKLSGGQRQRLAIAHRLSTVRNADHIVVLDDGRIVETGTHERLLDADGLYADLWRVQVGDLDALPDTFIEQAVGPADD